MRDEGVKRQDGSGADYRDLARASAREKSGADVRDNSLQRVDNVLKLRVAVYHAQRKCYTAPALCR